VGSTSNFMLKVLIYFAWALFAIELLFAVFTVAIRATQTPPVAAW